MTYFRHAFTSFEEFQREALRDASDDLGKEELELLDEMEERDNFHRRPAKRRRRALDLD